MRTRGGAATGAIAIVMVAFAVLPGAASATFPGSTGDMVWLGQVGDPFDPDAKPRQVITNSDPFSAPRWSPDGTRIAYMAGGSARSIWVVNADGSGARKVSNPQCCQSVYEYDYDPAWSADGKQIVFSRLHTHTCGESCEVHRGELRITSAETGGDGRVITQVEDPQLDYRFEHTEWQPGGDVLVTEVYHGELNVEVRELKLFNANGGSFTIHSSRPSNKYDLQKSGRRISWSPDGKRFAYVERHGRKVLFFNRDGTKLGETGLSDNKRIGGVTFTPDGAHLLIGACADVETFDSRCTQRLLLAPPEDADVDPNEPKETTLSGPGPDLDDFFKPDFQPADHPVILVPGFLGTELICAREGRLWPSLQRRDALLNLQLNTAGTANSAKTCGPAPGKVIGSYLTRDFYDPAMKALDTLLVDPNDPRTKDRVHPFPWDWRLDPRPQLAKLDALIATALKDELSVKQGLDEVILVGHSAGGLVIRAAMNDAARVKKIRRALAIGTPYLGTPKALFPLLAGVESPGGGDLGVALIPSELQQLSKNHTGNFILYPSAHYGPWVSEGGGRKLDIEGTVDYIHKLKASKRALAKAFDFKASISGFRRLEPYGLREFRVLAGSGLATIGGVAVLNGGKQAGLDFLSGDGTVPAMSATQTPPGATQPLGNSVRISHICKLDHLALVQHARVFDLMGDFIRYGSPPKKTEACDFSGFSYSVRDVGGTTTGSAAGAWASATPVGSAALKTLEKAEAGGALDVLALPGTTTIVMSSGTPGSVTIPVRDLEVTATPIGPRGAGKPVRYGSLTGRLQLGPGTGAKPSVKLNGRSVTSRPPAKLSIGAPRVTNRGALVVPVRNRGAKAAQVTVNVAARRVGSQRVIARLRGSAKISKGRSANITVRGTAGKLRGRTRVSIAAVVAGRTVARKAATLNVSR